MRDPRIKTIIRAAGDDQAGLFPVDLAELEVDLHQVMAPLELEQDDQPDATIQVDLTAGGPTRLLAGETFDRATYTDALASWLMLPLQELVGTEAYSGVLEVRPGLTGRHLLIETPITTVMDMERRQRLWRIIRDAVKGWWFDSPCGALITGESYEHEPGKSARELGCDEGPYYRYG